MDRWLHYNGFPSVLVRLEAIGADEIDELITDAWRCLAAESRQDLRTKPESLTERCACSCSPIPLTGERSAFGRARRGAGRHRRLGYLNARRRVRGGNRATARIEVSE